MVASAVAIDPDTGCLFQRDGDIVLGDDENCGCCGTPTLGACCHDPGLSSVCTNVLLADCDLIGGDFHPGDNCADVSCLVTPNLCPSSAYCNDNCPSTYAVSWNGHDGAPPCSGCGLDYNGTGIVTHGQGCSWFGGGTEDWVVFTVPNGVGCANPGFSGTTIINPTGISLSCSVHKHCTNLLVNRIVWRMRVIFHPRYSVITSSLTQCVQGGMTSNQWCGQQCGHATPQNCCVCPGDCNGSASAS